MLGIKVFAFMCVRVSVRYGQFPCDVCSHVMRVHMYVLVCVFVYICMSLICMSVYSCVILGGRQGDSNYICVFMCVHVQRRIRK